MKIAFTASGDNLKAPLDSRFGRAPKFLIYDTGDDSFEVFDNRQNLNAPQGAGIQSGETVSRLGAQAVVTGHVGPKAFRVLNTAGITVYLTDAERLEDALELYRAGKLNAINSADVEGHWA
ncbi:MAG: NifB/NifX family molybdenum-iron cluster-binding protein [Spirochaetia bacterium]